MNNPYDFFDEIVCINLESRKDKRKQAENVFNKLNIPAKFYTAIKSPHGGKYGCFESHINVIRKAYQKGLNNILIFEDDVLPSMYYSIDIINNCINFMKNNKNWDLFYLGYCIGGPLKFIFLPNIIKNDIHIGNILCCHAYAVNRPIMKDILDKSKYYLKNPNNIIHIDDFYVEKKFKSYYHKKNQFIQNNCLSTDNNYKIGNINLNNFKDRGSCLFSTKLQIDTLLYCHGVRIKLLIFIIILIIVIKCKLK